MNTNIFKIPGIALGTACLIWAGIKEYAYQQSVAEIQDLSYQRSVAFGKNWTGTQRSSAQAEFANSHFIHIDNALNKAEELHKQRFPSPFSVLNPFHNPF